MSLPNDQLNIIEGFVKDQHIEHRIISQQDKKIVWIRGQDVSSDIQTSIASNEDGIYRQRTVRLLWA